MFQCNHAVKQIVMDDEKYKEFTNSIRKIAEASEPLYRQAELEYTSLVNSLIKRQCKDSKEIEQLLDGLLNFASDKRILNLFRKLGATFLLIACYIAGMFLEPLADFVDGLLFKLHYKRYGIVYPSYYLLNTRKKHRFRISIEKFWCKVKKRQREETDDQKKGSDILHWPITKPSVRCCWKMRF